jgi:hypothetical protein
MNSFSGGENIRECLEAVVGVALARVKHFISNISLSRFTLEEELRNSRTKLKKA